ncbi:hypothetical protein CMI47_04695 [Candidatus Pacearchaeota archaeon]|jgi:replicative DNA helicase|nr:hypothetical protein [Candidatus Pacearchaeota archaeon]|tara:strand:+ start:13280 stop:14749 length:1470 start_codon:yes stop_codon:yes gene_type:complete
MKGSNLEKNIEAKFLNLVINSNELMVRAIDAGVSEEYFTEESSVIIFKSCFWSFDNHKKLTDFNFEYFCKNICGLSSAALVNYVPDFQSISSCDIPYDDYESVVISLKYQYLTRRFKDKLGDLKDSNAGNFEEKLEDFNIEVSKLLSTSEEGNFSFFDTAEVFDGFIEDLHEKANNPEEKVQCGMSEIDECMVVGFKPGTLTLTVADVGGGKSTMMLNIAFNLFKKNHNVMFLPLEMPFEEIFKKFLSRETLIDFNKLANPALLTDQDWEILKSHGDIIKKFNQKFIWADVKSRPTVSEIKRAIERKLKYFKPAVVVIDYIANIKPDAGSDNWLAIGDILKELRAMGKEHDFAILSAAQLTRDGIKKLKNDKDMSKTPGSEDLRGSHEYSADSDNIFAQMPSLDEPNRKMLLYCIKARYGKKTFGDKNYAILDYYPEFSKIESSAVNNFTSSDSKLDDAIDFMQKINQDFDDELNDTSGSGDEFGWLDL